MALFLSLYLGHILGDFVFQPGRLVVAKRKRAGAVLLHTAIVTACTALVLAGSLRSAWIPVIVSGLAHLAVERLTILARRTPDSSNLAVFVLDQALHAMSLALVAVLAGSEIAPGIGPWAVSVATLATACGITTVAFGGSILVFEAQQATGPADGSDTVLSLDGPRVYGIIERGAALIGALVLPSPALGVLAFAPRALYAASLPREQKRRQWIAIGAGLGLCAVVWALVTSVAR